jgi:hypothetical protein
MANNLHDKVPGHEIMKPNPKLTNETEWIKSVVDLQGLLTLAVSFRTLSRHVLSSDEITGDS